ncbi:glycine/serine hydroxymethyltransferase [Frankia sp. CcI6]|uniref:glycine/serine hydroxymethyltransferase n=1 Tax=unclassified Frankia TaxID=2632575 RepID=UPI0003D01717|nr:MULTISPECIES: glycine/serine hydroxymethyltransferase [unclassified Frankia]ETA00771.1 glycine/serine hydroxymethyltransferase [Frankia sp. CcI6]OHV51761.1 hypothetical protein CgIS1_18100 [Frankia sp. CgIS1]
MNVAEVLSLVTRYHQASARRLHLVPSENAMSLAARLPFLTDVIHRYCFTADGENWAWPGNNDLAAIEQAAAEGLRELFGADYVNLKPISGINSMAVAVSALADHGGTVFSIGEADGGHGSTRFLAQRLGLAAVALPYDRRRYEVDTDQLATLAAATPGPKLVYLDQFMCLFPHDLPALRAAVGPETLIHYDGSHVMGLIAGGQFQDPLAEGADCLGGSTHKSFPGPHKGVILTNSDDLAKKIDEHASHWVSHHHVADVAALAVTVADLRESGGEYAARTVRNARHLGGALADRGFAVCAAERGFTRSHQLWIDIAPLMDPFQASQALLAAGIVVNAIDVPYLTPGTGLRLGVQEVTRLGMDTDAMYELAHLFARLLIKRDEPSLVAAGVDDLRRRHTRAHDEAFDPMMRDLVLSILAREDG